MRDILIYISWFGLGWLLSLHYHEDQEDRKL